MSLAQLDADGDLDAFVRPPPGGETGTLTGAGGAANVAQVETIPAGKRDLNWYHVHHHGEESGAGNTMMSLNNVGKTPQGEATVGTRPEDIRMT